MRCVTLLGCKVGELLHYTLIYITYATCATTHDIALQCMSFLSHTLHALHERHALHTLHYIYCIHLYIGCSMHCIVLHSHELHCSAALNDNALRHCVRIHCITGVLTPLYISSRFTTLDCNTLDPFSFHCIVLRLRHE